MASTARSARRPTREALEAVIRDTGGNLTAAAGRLGCTRQTVYVWIYQHGLDRLAGVRSLEAVQNAAGDEPRPLNVTVPAGLHRWVRSHAVMTDRPAYAVVVEALELLRAVVEGGAPEEANGHE